MLAELHRTTHPAPAAARTRAEAMADAMYAIQAESLGGTATRSDLLREGFTRAELNDEQLVAEAYRICDERVNGGEAAPYNRPARLLRAVRLTSGLLPQPLTLHLQLRNAGYSNTEIADLWGEVLAAIAADLRTTKLPEVL